jgi:hypothetical protein
LKHYDIGYATVVQSLIVIKKILEEEGETSVKSFKEEKEKLGLFPKQIIIFVVFKI